MADQSPAIEKFVEIVSPACDKPNSQIIVVGTPQSHFDLFHKLSETTGYVFEKFKCCERIFKGEVEGPVLFPERFSVHQLQLKYWELGYGAFMQEMMTEPIQPGDVIFDYETLIKGCIDEQLKDIQYAVPTYEYWLGVDIALSKERAADQSAYVVIEKRPGDKMLRLVHMQIPTKGTYTDQQFEQIKDLHRRFRFKRILIENKGNSMSLVEFLQRDQQTCGVVEQFPTTHTEKERVIMKLQKLMSNGLLEIIKDDLLIGELQQIGIKHEWRAGRSLEKIQSLGGHDDIVIAFALAVEAATSAVGQASLIWV
jgi:hypothetical protein